MSDDAKAFIMGLLNTRADKRWSMAEALKADWFKSSHIDNSEEFSLEVVKFIMQVFSSLAYFFFLCRPLLSRICYHLPVTVV